MSDEDKKPIDGDFWKGLDKMREAFAEADKELDDIVEWCDHTMKLAVTKWVMKHIVEHAKEGGSYRYLIYDRLGFGPEAYAPLCSDGLTISNEFDLEQKDSIIELVKEHKYDKLKPVLGLCDEPDCFDTVTCGWPSEEGYRQTCGNHWKTRDYNA
jgi:hypothetical protein